MHERTPHSIDENDLQALADGQLPPPHAQAVRERLGAEDAKRLAAWQLQRERLRALHAGMAQEPLPEPLRSTAARLQERQDRQTLLWRWGGMAASVLLAFGLGWTLHGQWQPGHAGSATPLASVQRFAQQAAVAHAVYQPEQRHPVEVGAAQQEHLVQWLSKRLGAQLKAPVLQSRGYELVGGRLLPGDDGARAQFMYQDSGGERITLYVTVLPKGSSPGATAFRFEEGSPVAAFYWIDGDFGYALSGNLPRNTLLELSELVYSQLTG